MHSILIIDDDENVLRSLARLLRDPEYGISCFSDPAEALIHCTTRSFDLVLSDQRMPSMQGTEFFEQLAALQPETRRILISGYSDFSSVINAFNLGVIHKFVLKPWDNAQLKSLVAEQLDQQAGENGVPGPDLLAADTACNTISSADNFHGIVTEDAAMREQLGIIQQAANSEVAFFINGETGTGKELVARAIHLESARAENPFVALNCANLTDTLLESQLFGHRKGAFTGAQRDQQGLLEAAEGGTLFLDEVTEIPLTLQAKLLRVLQEREYTPLGETKVRSFDVKLISASALSLERAVSLGKFREDLRYRLEVMPLNLPPLRARGQDIRLLFDYFLKNQLERHGRQMLKVEADVYDKIATYPWPGNIRELVNVCTYIAALSNAETQRIGTEQLPPTLRQIDHALRSFDRTEPATAPVAPQPPVSRAISKEALEQAIEHFGGHRESIANHFGISRMTLWRRMKQLGLE